MTGTTEETVDDFLEHFGKKGMKWGVRKDKDSNDREQLSGKRKAAIVAGSAAAVLVMRRVSISPVAQMAGGAAGGLAVNAILKRRGAEKANG